jgi:hypothetical protein
VIARFIGRLATALTRLAHKLGVHHYLSTGCLHGEHVYCQGKTGQAGVKVPAKCKFCEARCRCRCHRDAPVRIAATTDQPPDRP